MPITADLADRTVAGVRRFCESADVETDLLAGIAARIRPAVPWDTGVLFATDPATTLFTDAHVMGFDPETCTPWFHHELNVEDVNLFRDLAGSGWAADHKCYPLAAIGYGFDQRPALRRHLLPEGIQRTLVAAFQGCLQCAQPRAGGRFGGWRGG